MSTPKALQLPSGVRRLTIETSRGKFAALEALPPSGVHERQPALLVPGYTGSKEDFLLILQALAAAGRQVVAIDMRGQFETPGADDAAAYQLGALAADVALVADWLSEGHDGAASRGVAPGRPAGRRAERAPARPLPRRAGDPGSAAGAGRPDQFAHPDEFRPGGADRPAGPDPAGAAGRAGRDQPGQLGAEVERIWRTRMEPEAVSGNVPPAIIDFLRTRLLSSSPTGLRAMAETLLTCPDRTPALARLDSVPLMVLYGENDDAWDPAAQEDMAARLRAQRICIPAAAHSPAVEAPETTASTLTSFWNATECQPGPPVRRRPADPGGPERRSVAGQLLQAIPRAAGGGGRGPFRAHRAEVTPAAARARAGRELLVLARGRQPVTVALVRGRALGGDVLGPAHMPLQRGGRVLPGVHRPGGQVMQLHPVAGPAQHPRGGDRVQRQRQRGPGVVGAQRAAAGLVVHHDQFPVADGVPAVVQPVDPAGERDPVGPGAHRPLHPGRLVGGVQRRRRNPRPCRGPGSGRPRTGRHSRSPR